LAAEQGHADAQWNLGLMYEVGVGVPQDYVAAHVWLNLSASRRNSADSNRELVAHGRDRVVGKMNPDQLAEAQRLAREWDAAHPRR
jgi:TPR repeat protein